METTNTNNKKRKTRQKYIFIWKKQKSEELFLAEQIKLKHALSKNLPTTPFTRLPRTS